MTRHAKFKYKNAEDLIADFDRLGLDIPFSNDISPLFDEILINNRKLANRLVVHPMEGFDSEENGSPSDLVKRRYSRYATGGSGMIWFEACSVSPEGRSNPRQMMLSGKNLPQFQNLVESIKTNYTNEFSGRPHQYLVLQLTHSGRFCKPEGVPKPLVAINIPHVEKHTPARILSDSDLEYIRDKYIESAELAWKAGFDSVDIKACHGYLLHELLFSFNRENSIYGGQSFENRTRLISEIIDGISDKVPAIDISARISLYDGVSYPYGFGTDNEDPSKPNFSEPFKLIEHYKSKGCSLINGSAGIPYMTAHIGRPFDREIPGTTKPDEHPLEGVSRLIDLVGTTQKHTPGVPFVGTAYSWLRHFFPNVAAGVLKKGKASLIGLGRYSFAYPDAARDLLNEGKLNPKKTCITCSSCTELMRNGHISGCTVRDRDIYAAEYKEMILRLKNEK